MRSTRKAPGRRTSTKYDEVIEEGTNAPLDMDPNEVIEADDETLPYEEEDWQDPEQMEVPKNLETDLPFTMQTRQSDGTRPRKKYNPYGDDFVVYRIDLKKIVEEVVGLEEITVSQDVDRESMKHMKTERDDPSLAAKEGQLLIPASNLDLISGMRSTGTSMDIFVRGVGVGLTHSENLIIKKLKIARETET